MRQLNDNVHRIDVTGYAMWAYADGQPMLVALEGHLFLPIYATRQRAELGRAIAMPPEPVTLKQITDHADFLASVREAGLRVMVDPYIADGNTRFIELKLEGES